MFWDLGLAGHQMGQITQLMRLTRSMGGLGVDEVWNTTVCHPHSVYLCHTMIICAA